MAAGWCGSQNVGTTMQAFEETVLLRFDRNVCEVLLIVAAQCLILIVGIIWNGSKICWSSLVLIPLHVSQKQMTLSQGFV